MISIFKESALWANYFFKLKCPYVCMSVCLSVRFLLFWFSLSFVFFKKKSYDCLPPYWFWTLLVFPFTVLLFQWFYPVLVSPFILVFSIIYFPHYWFSPLLVFHLYRLPNLPIFAFHCFPLTWFFLFSGSSLHLLLNFLVFGITSLFLHYFSPLLDFLFIGVSFTSFSLHWIVPLVVLSFTH